MFKHTGIYYLFAQQIYFTSCNSQLIFNLSVLWSDHTTGDTYTDPSGFQTVIQNGDLQHKKKVCTLYWRLALSFRNTFLRSFLSEHISTYIKYLKLISSGPTSFKHAKKVSYRTVVVLGHSDPAWQFMVNILLLNFGFLLLNVRLAVYFLIFSLLTV